ncbi:MAG: Rpn family recombination-promoting nuclease/putative transposase [Myxococcales bacterium]|nr:Rpn family recombination-promoting nuclease/putative transposase [Myxococcales bacterium]
MALLHPTEDIVFKLFFTRNPRLLCSLIEEVLRRPVASAVVQSAALELAFADDRGVLLDILAELPDGTRVNVEMQCDPRGFTPERWLYYWARIFAKGIERGDEFTDLTPVVCIVLLDTERSGRFHEHYAVCEVERHTAFSDMLAIHVIELPRFAEHAVDEPARLVRWGHFLHTSDPAALDSLAVEDPMMAEAKQALETLSADPDAQALAEARRDAKVVRSEYLKQVRKEGLAEGLAEGRAEGRVEGRVEGLASALDQFAAAIGLPVPPERRAHWLTMTAAELERLATHVFEHQAWPPAD